MLNLFSLIKNKNQLKIKFFILSLSGFISGAYLRLFDTILPIISYDYNISVQQASIAVTSFGVSYGFFQLFHGPLSDKFGLIKIITFNTIFLSIISFFTFFSKNIFDLSILRFISGIFAGSIIPLTLAWIADNTEYKHRQKVLGKFLGYVLLGSIAGPISGGMISQLLTWKHNFLFFSLILFLLSVFFLIFQEKSRENSLILDGNIILKRYTEIIQNKWARLVLITVFFEGAFFYGSFAFSGAYLKDRFSLDYSLIGIFLSAFGIGGVIYSFLVNFLVKKISKPIFVISGGVVVSLSFIIISTTFDHYLIFLGFILSGLGFYLIHNTIQTFSSEMSPNSRGMALALHAFCLFSGSAFGVYVNSFIIKFLTYEISYVFSAISLLLLSIIFRKKIIIYNKN